MNDNKEDKNLVNNHDINLENNQEINQDDKLNDSDYIMSKKLDDEEKELTDKKQEEKKKLYIGSGKPVGIFDLYFKFSTKTDYILIFLAMLGSLGSGVAMPLFSILFGGTISEYGPKNDAKSLEDSINSMVIKFLLVGLGMFVANFMNSSLWIYTSIKNLTILKKEYFKVIMNQEQGWFDQNNPFEFSTLVQTQIKTIEAGLGDKLGNVLMSFSMFVSGLIVAFTTSWKLTLVLFSVLPLMIIGAMFLTKAVQGGAKNASDAYAKAGGVSEEVLYQIKTVASFANFDYETERYDKLVNLSKNISITNGLKSGFGIGFIFLVLYGAYCLAVWYGSTLIFNGAINNNSNKPFSGGDVLTVLLSTIMAGFSLGGSAPNIKAIFEAKIAASDLFELRERIPLIDETLSTKKPNKDSITGKIEFKNVKFSYPKNPSKMILKNISFNFEAGKKTAIVGESGSGKSTIVNLLERLYDTTEGEIIIDGINIREFDIQTLRSYIGYVQQEPVLFNESIRENLIFGRENVTDEMIDEACTQSLASEFIDRIKEKYDFIVGIKGKNLSGGQKQRLAIARAILSKPKILILDEATSALDNRNEKEVQISLDKVSVNVTTIVIAHRLTTIINADTIIAMKEGEIVEVGSHLSLLEKGGYYSTLFKSQLIKEKEEKIEIDDDKNGINQVEGERLKTEEKLALFSSANLEKNPINNIYTEKEDVLLNKEKELDEVVSKKRGKLFTFLSNDKLTIFFASFSAACSGAIFPLYGFTLAAAIEVLSSKDMMVVEKDGFFMAMMFLVLAGGASISMLFQNYLFAKIGEILCQKLRSAVFKKYLQMHIGFYDIQENSPGALITRLSSDTTKLNGIVLTMIGVSVQTFVNLIVGIVLGFIYDWRLSLIALAFLPLLAGSTAFQHRLRKGLIQSDEELDIESGSVLSESVINTKTIFSFNMQKKIVLFYQEISGRGTKNLIKQSLISGFFFGISQFVLFATYAVIFYAGGSFILNGSLDFGSMMKAILCILFAAAGIGNAQQYMGDYSKAKLALESIFSVLDAESTIDPLDENNKLKMDAGMIKGKIEFRNVNFAYPTRPDQKVLKNISFVIESGKNIAFTGFSGSGKSTIIQLIERFYDVNDGEILIDGVNIKDYNLLSLRKKMGLVMQEPNIFKRTVAENIQYGRLEANYEEIKAAAITANLAEFFTDNIRGMKDDNVSGGQKQRISIARAILKNPRILLLDEATSALDKKKEEKVQKAIDNASKNRTTVTVAHRLATIEKCDLIFVLNQGMIVEKGTHSDLLGLKGLYWKQYNCKSD